MGWSLKVQTGGSGAHEIDLGDDEAEAKAALERARDALRQARQRTARGGALVTIEDRVVVPAADVTALSIEYLHPPSVG